MRKDNKGLQVADSNGEAVGAAPPAIGLKIFFSE